MRSIIAILLLSAITAYPQIVIVKDSSNNVEQITFFNNPSNTWSGFSLTLDGTTITNFNDFEINYSNIIWPNATTNWTWTNNGSEITLTGYSGPDDVVIPNIIEGLPVTKLGEPASPASQVFLENTNITSVIGGDNITELHWAFYGCSNLVSVSMKNITTTGEQVFRDCVNLTSVTLPSLQYVNDSVFNDCVSLTNISLPSATVVRQYAFVNCSNLVDVIFGQNAPIEETNVFMGATNVVVHVNNPVSTGWGSVWNGRPVIRVPIVASWHYFIGSESIDNSWRLGYNDLGSNVVMQVRVAGTWTNTVQFLAP